MAEYHPLCLHCRIEAGKSPAGTTELCYDHLHKDRDRLREGLEAERERTRLIFVAMQPGLDVLGVGGGDADPTDFAGAAERCVADRDRLAAEVEDWQGLYDNMAALTKSNHATIAELRARLAEAEAVLESHAWEVSPAMAQAKIEQQVAALVASEARCAALTEALTFCAREFEPYSKCGYCTSPGGKHELWCTILVAQRALSSPPVAAMARLLEAVQVFVADWERSDGGRTIETIENDALEIVDAARAVWAEGGEG